MRFPAAASACLLLGACATPPGGFDSPVPAARLAAITEAARTHDQSAIPDLITMLESDDAAVRLASIRTLEELTGTTRGYDYAAPQWERDDRIRDWLSWYRASRGPLGPEKTLPASSSPGASVEPIYGGTA